MTRATLNCRKCNRAFKWQNTLQRHEQMVCGLPPRNTDALENEFYDLLGREYLNTATFARLGHLGRLLGLEDELNDRVQALAAWDALVGRVPNNQM